MQSIYDILLSNATLLELYRSKGYTDTQLALENALELINKRIEKTQGSWTTQKLNAIKKLIEDEILKSYGGLFEAMQDESTAIAQITYNAIIGASMSAAIPTALINDLTKSNRLIQGYEFKELFKLTQENHARQLRVSLLSAIGAGMTPTQITQELNKKNESLTRSQLATNVRTVIFNAANEASYKSYAKLEKDGFIDYYEYVAVLDSRTSEICRNNDGRKFYMPIDEITTKPDLHFNCRSKLVPRNKYSRKDGTRASQFGAVPSNETYSTWFARQDAGFQKSVLGSKFGAYKSGVYKIGGLPDVLGKPLSLQQVSDVLEEFVKEDSRPIFNQLGIKKEDDIFMALDSWTGGEDYHIKQSFRQKINNDLDKMKEVFSDSQIKEIEAFNRMFSDFKPNEFDNLYRGMYFMPDDKFYDKFKDLKVGDTIEDLAPASWSSDIEVAKQFTGQFEDDKLNGIMLKYKKGKGYEIDKLSAFEEEKEVLVAPTNLKILKIEKENDVIIFEVEE